MNETFDTGRNRELDESTDRVVARIDTTAKTIHSTRFTRDGDAPPAIPATPEEVNLASDQAMSLEGRLVGRYRIVKLINHGGMGSVYQALDPLMDRIVALKLCRLSSDDAEADRQRFRAEITAAARLRHPNIVAILDSGTASGVDFFVMEYIEGMTLGDWVREFHPPYRVRAQVVRDVAEGVQHAHEQGVLHRDIKPGNIIIDGTGNPHITDFGLAKQLNVDLNLTLIGEAIGTPNYMPPEQASGQQGLIGFHSDVWGLGAVLYEILTYRPPFKGDTAHDVLLAVIERDPVKPRDLSNDIPRDLETIALKCLEKNIHRRYQSALDMAADLNRHIQNVPIHARPPSLPYLLWKFGARHRTAMGVAGLLLAMVITVVAIIMGQQSRQVSDWQLLPEVTFTAGAVGEFGIFQTDLRSTAQPAAIDANGLALDDGRWLWLTGLAVPQDVRLEVDLVWTSIPDTLQLCINADRDALDAVTALPRGYIANLQNSLDGTCSIRRIQDEDEILRLNPVNGQHFGVARVVFQRLGSSLYLYHNGTLICEVDDLLPMSSSTHDGIGLRTSHAGTRIRAVRVFRRPLPELSSPLVAADSLTNHGLWQKAADQYMTIYQDYKTSAFAPEALAKVYLTAIRAGDTQLAVRADAILAEDWSDSPFRVFVLRSKIRYLWLTGKQLDAMDRCEELLGIDAASRILEFLLRNRHYPMLEPTKQRIFQLLPQCTARLDLDLSRLGLIDLAFLENVRMSRLDVSHNRLENLDVLADADLANLNCSHNQIFDLTPVCNSNLTILDCSFNPVRSLKPLGKTALAYLNASATAITDLDGLEGLALKVLRLDHTGIGDLAPLRSIRLRDFSVSGTGIRQLTQLNTESLVRIDLSATDITTIDALGAGRSLRDVNLAYTGITTIDALTGLGLDRLDLTATGVTDPSPLGGLPVTWLSLALTPVRDLSGLGGMPVEHLDLRGTQVRDLQPLATQPLVWLSLADTRINDLAPLRGRPLRHLDLARSDVIDLQALKGMSLTSLDLSFTKVTNLSPLTGLDLRVLRIDGSSVTDLAPIRDHLLSECSLVSTAITDLRPLQTALLRCVNAVDVPVAQVPVDLFARCPLTIIDPRRCTPALLDGMDTQTRLVPLVGIPDHRRVVRALTAGTWSDLRGLAPGFGGSRYLLIPRIMLREEAVALAQQVGADLLDIGSEEEWDFITTTFGPLPLWTRLSSYHLVLNRRDASAPPAPRRENWLQEMDRLGTCIRDGLWLTRNGASCLTVLEWRD